VDQVRGDLCTPARATALLYLAMARARLGQVDGARAVLSRATEIIEKRIPAEDNQSYWPEDWLICQVARREADALILGVAPHVSATRPTTTSDSMAGNTRKTK
jgi:hypothetical protein